MAATRYKTYQDRFADPRNDPFAGNYRAIMKLFATKTSGRRSPNAAISISSRVFATAGVQPHAFLHLSVQDNKAQITVLHQPITLVRPLGEPGSDEFVILLGDQRGRSPPITVYMPEDAFKQVANVRVPTIPVLTLGLSDPSIESFGPYDEEDQGTEVVSTSSCMMYIPPPYVPQALASSSLTPHEAWEKIGAQIVGGPTQAVDLAPLVDWLAPGCSGGRPR